MQPQSVQCYEHLTAMTSTFQHDTSLLTDRYTPMRKCVLKTTLLPHLNGVTSAASAIQVIWILLDSS